MLAARTEAPTDPITEAQRVVENWRKLHDGHRYFDDHPRYQDPLHDLGVERVRDMLLPTGVDTVLEIGCGYGRLLYHLLPDVTGVVGIDLAPEPLAKAEELLATRKRDEQRVSLVLGDGISLDALDDGCASAAVAFTVFQHMPKVAVGRYLEDLRRILTPGGRVCFQVADDGTPEHYGRDICADLPKEQATRWCASGICAVVEAAGLTVQRVDRECLKHTYPGRGMSWIWVLATV